MSDLGLILVDTEVQVTVAGPAGPAGNVAYTLIADRPAADVVLDRTLWVTTDNNTEVLWQAQNGNWVQLAGPFIYTQGVASTLWTITHNMGKYPAVNAVVGSLTVICDIDYISADVLKLGFAIPVSGTAYLS